MSAQRPRRKTGLVNGDLLPVMMTLVIVPHWVWSGEDLAVFHGKTMKARFARKWSPKVLQTFWMRRLTTIRSRSAAEIVLFVTKSSSTAFA